MVTNIVAMPDGSLGVYDTIARSFSIFDSDFNLIRRSPLPYRPTLVWRDGQYLVAEQIRTRERVGQPIHLLGSDGSVMRSFGAESDTYRADEPLRYDRIVAPSSDGMLWTSALGRYVLEQWDPATGNRLSVVAVRSTWFKESARFPPRSQRPVPLLLALWEEEGRLWVLRRDADSNWRAPAPSRTERRVTTEDYDRTYDSVLEVVAIPSGEVIASRRFDRAVYGGGPQFLVATRTPPAADGVRRLNVWRPGLVGKEKRR